MNAARLFGAFATGALAGIGVLIATSMMLIAVGGEYGFWLVAAETLTSAAAALAAAALRTLPRTVRSLALGFAAGAFTFAAAGYAALVNVQF